MVIRASNKEEAEKNRVELGRVEVQDQEHKSWMRFIKLEGNEFVSYVQPWVGKRLTPEQREKREKEVEARKKRAEIRKQKAVENKKLAEQKKKIRDEYKKKLAEVA